MMPAEEGKTGESMKSRESHAARLKRSSKVFTRFAEMRELEDGYAFRYRRTHQWEATLARFTELWSEGCPTITFQLLPGRDHGDIWLEIRGPEGTKNFVRGARRILTTNLNPQPTAGNRLRRGLRLATCLLRVLPDFLIIGAKKCGTTALYSYLAAHPRVAPAYQKEVQFFNSRRWLGMWWYRSFFPTFFEKIYARAVRGGEVLTGEATPDYLHDWHVPQKVFRAIPDVKLIALLRNPVDRAYSFYQHQRRGGFETLSFEAAIAEEESRLRGETEKVIADERYHSHRLEHFSYLSRGRYTDQLERWDGFFPKSRILVLSTEELHEKPASTLTRALDFLGLPYSAPDQFEQLNAIPYAPMDQATRTRLVEYFEPHNRRLYEFLGRSLGWDR